MVERLMTDENLQTYSILITGSVLFVILLTLIYQNIELRRENKQLIKLRDNQREIIARNRMEWLRKGILFDDEEDSEDIIDINIYNKRRN